MFSWFLKKPKLSLAPLEEREAVLVHQHPLFREVDAAFHAYLEVVAARPRWEDGLIERELVRRGVAAGLAEDCVVFGPLAWGREVVENMGVDPHPLVRVRSLIDGGAWEQPTADELVYAWARATIGLYRTPERNDLFVRVANRSAEVACISDALRAGANPAELRGCPLEPTLVPLRRPTPARGADAGRRSGPAPSVPRLLEELLDAGRWPRDEKEAAALSERFRASPERVRAMAPEEDRIDLLPPPFHTVRRLSESNPFWLWKTSVPSGIDFDLALEIGDFGLGSDAPILLDYREDASNPRVLRLRWAGGGEANAWVVVAPDFRSFVRALGL